MRIELTQPYGPGQNLTFAVQRASDRFRLDFADGVFKDRSKSSLEQSYKATIEGTGDEAGLYVAAVETSLEQWPDGIYNFLFHQGQIPTPLIGFGSLQILGGQAIEFVLSKVLSDLTKAIEDFPKAITNLGERIDNAGLHLTITKGVS